MRARAILAMLPAAIERERRRELMESAFYENVRLIGQNTAGGAGGYIKASYTEVLDMLKSDAHEKTGEEVVADILARLGG